MPASRRVGTWTLLLFEPAAGGWGAYRIAAFVRPDVCFAGTLFHQAGEADARSDDAAFVFGVQRTAADGATALCLVVAPVAGIEYGRAGPRTFGIHGKPGAA